MVFKRWLLCLTATTSTIVVASFQPALSFNPLQYKKSTARCSALLRRGVVVAEESPSAAVIETEINLKYIDVNPTTSSTILMVHGWPGLWSSWARQIEAFENDHHLLIPDLRGFGESSHPGNPQVSGSLPDMVGDLVCILKRANVRNAICMGHDWGSSICFEAARSRPDIFTAVVDVVVPYIPADAPFVPTNALGSLVETLRYQAYFHSNPDAAAKELSEDVRRTIRGVLRAVDSPPPAPFLKSNESFLHAWRHVEEIPPVPFFSPEEEDYYVSQYEHSGFRNTLQFYSNENRHFSWKFAHDQGNHTILQPVLAVYPTQDPVANWEELAKILKSATFIPNLTTKTMPGAHWAHLENPELFNSIVRDWLHSVAPYRNSLEPKKVADEL